MATTVTFKRDKLLALQACKAGLTMFDDMWGEDGTLEYDWTPATALLKSKAWAAFGSFLYRHELIPAVSAPGHDAAGMDLSGAYMRDANLEGINLEGANLARTKLRGANLKGANLKGADLTRADLRGAHLDGADLTDAQTEGALGL